MTPELASLIRRGYPAHNRQVREALVTEVVTLDGRPAQIVGCGCKYATVRTNAEGYSVQYSWHAAMHVVVHNAGGFTP
jgi:hypothetical protein